MKSDAALKNGFQKRERNAERTVDQLTNEINEQESLELHQMLNVISFHRSTGRLSTFFFKLTFRLSLIKLPVQL
jgi:hypothetical protein